MKMYQISFDAGIDCPLDSSVSNHVLFEDLIKSLKMLLSQIEPRYNYNILVYDLIEQEKIATIRMDSFIYPGQFKYISGRENFLPAVNAALYND